MIDVERAEREIARALAVADYPARYYWQTAERVAGAVTTLQAVTAAQAPTSAILHVKTIDALHGEAAQMRADQARVELWSQASTIAALHGPPPGGIRAWRAAVMAVLHSWATVEDEDRWVASLPSCDAGCKAGDEWSQVGHKIECRRGRAWRRQYKISRGPIDQEES